MTVKRPMLWLTASFVAGMYVLALFDASVLFAVIFCAFLALGFVCFKTHERFTRIVCLLSAILFTTGAFLYGFTDDIKRKPLYEHIGNDVVLSGEVLETPEISEKYIRFQFKGASVFANENTKPIKEILDVIFFFNNGKSLDIVPERGDVISFTANVSLPERAMNKGGFDYARYLKSRGVYFQAIGESETISVSDHNTHAISDFFYNIRTECARLLDSILPVREAGVLKAYIIGDDSGINETVSRLFSETGLSHILAVSGMHLVVFLGSLVAILRVFRISKRKQLVFSLIAVVLYVLFTGASVSAVRSGLVVFLAIIARILFKRSDPLTALSEAAAILCAFRPQIIFDISFILSFSATLGILLFSKKISKVFKPIYKNLQKGSRVKKFIRSIFDLLSVGIAAQVFVIPILLYYFQQISVISVIATVILNPFLAPILVGGLLFCIAGFISPYLAFPFAGFIYLLTKGMLALIEIFAGMSLFKLTYGSVSPYFLLMYALFLSVLYFLFIKRNKKYYLITLCSFTVLTVGLLFHTVNTTAIAEVSFINVGNGDCSLIKAPNNCDILIDAGGEKNNTKIAKNVVKPYLIKSGVYDVEYAIASHGHEDHVNGLTGLMDEMKIKHLLVPQGFGTTEESMALIQKAREKNVPITYLKHGDELQFGEDFKIKVIMPDDKYLNFISGADENHRSLLLRIEYGDVSFLFTGDLPSEGENYATAMYPDMIPADVLKVAHHGSDTSTSDLFLDTVNPTYAYIPVGENYYGHPSNEVLTKLTRKGVQYFRADTHRDVTFYFDEQGFTGIRTNQAEDTGGNNELR